LLQGCVARFPHDGSAVNSPLIINESQVANSSIAMVRGIRKVVQLDVGGIGVKRIPKASQDFDVCDKGKRLRPSVPLCSQWFWYTFVPLDFPSSKVLKVEPFLEG